MKPITFSLQFRGQVVSTNGSARLHKQASAPSCALVTTLTANGVDGRFVWGTGDDEALLESTLTVDGDGTFYEEGTILFARGNSLRIKGYGELSSSADPELRQGAVVWKVAGGQGRLEGATGLITSNFVLSETGELTENQLGVIFAGPHGL